MTRVDLYSGVSLILSDKSWSVFWCVSYSVTRVGLYSGVSLTLSDNGWSVFLCVSYTE